jgi:hypothetical protein
LKYYPITGLSESKVNHVEKIFLPQDMLTLIKGEIFNLNLTLIKKIFKIFQKTLAFLLSMKYNIIMSEFPRIHSGLKAGKDKSFAYPAGISNPTLKVTAHKKIKIKPVFLILNQNGAGDGGLKNEKKVQVDHRNLCGYQPKNQRYWRAEKTWLYPAILKDNFKERKCFT